MILGLTQLLTAPQSGLLLPAVAVLEVPSMAVLLSVHPPCLAISLRSLPARSELVSRPRRRERPVGRKDSPGLLAQPGDDVADGLRVEPASHDGVPARVQRLVGEVRPGHSVPHLPCQAGAWTPGQASRAPSERRQGRPEQSRYVCGIHQHQPDDSEREDQSRCGWPWSVRRGHRRFTPGTGRSPQPSQDGESEHGEQQRSHV